MLVHFLGSEVLRAHYGVIDPVTMNAYVTLIVAKHMRSPVT